MDPRRLFNLSVTITRRGPSGTVDEYGNPTTTTTTAGPYAGNAWQASATERTTDANTQAEEWRVVLEVAAAGQVDGADALTFGGKTFEVLGTPWLAVNPRTNEPSHLEMAARRTVEA